MATGRVPGSIVPGASEEEGSKINMDDATSMDVDTDSIDGQMSKKRKTKPSNRAVAHLTPEQLAKKRANDREAQRAIRERTKKQIETLELRIEELTAQKPYQELQAVIRAKEEVERENTDIKQQLANITKTLQMIVGNTTYPSPGLSQPNSGIPTHSSDRTSVARPESAAPPSIHSVANSYAVNSQASSPAQSQGLPGTGTEHSRLELDQQLDQLQHGLDMGQERLKLGFLLESNQQAARIHRGQDRTNFLDGHTVDPYVQGSTSVLPPSHPANNIANTPSHSSFGSGYAYNDPGLPAGAKAHDGYSTELVDLGNNLGHVPRFSAPLCRSPPTCPLDQLLIDFIRERRERTAEGRPAHEVLGPRYPSVYSLLNPAHSVYSHPLSRVFTDILAKFPDISGLPERVAVLYIVFLIIRWQVLPNKENYERLPPWMRPSNLQLRTRHAAWIDHLPFPRMRDKIISLYTPEEYHFDHFFVPYTTTIRLSWPYEDTDTLLRSPDSDELVINPVFERHLRNLDNWKLGQSFARAFPTLVDTCNFNTIPQPRSTSSVPMESPQAQGR